MMAAVRSFPFCFFCSAMPPPDQLSVLSCSSELQSSLYSVLRPYTGSKKVQETRSPTWPLDEHTPPSDHRGGRACKLRREAMDVAQFTSKERKQARKSLLKKRDSYNKLAQKTPRQQASFPITSPSKVS